MGVCSQMLVLLIVVFACARARPSDPSRESRAANEFKFVSSPQEWAYMTSTTLIPQYDVATPSSLHPHTTSWLHHSPYSFGLPLLKMPPHSSNMYYKVSPAAPNLFMVFNGRLAMPHFKHLKEKPSISAFPSALFGTHSFTNNVYPSQNTVQHGNFIKTPAIFQHKPEFYHQNVIKDIFSGNIKTSAVSHKDILEQTTPKPSKLLLPEVTLHVSGNSYDIIPTTSVNSKREDEDIELIKQTIESASVNSSQEVTPGKPSKPTSLVLKPIAKAVAGVKGVAIAAPISRAVIKKGQDVNIHFEPQAVAVVGPGGLADAHSDLVISYLDELTSHQTQKPL